MRQAVSKAEQAVLERLVYLVGSPEVVAGMEALPAKVPFDGEVLEFLNDLSKVLLHIDIYPILPLTQAIPLNDLLQCAHLLQ